MRIVRERGAIVFVFTQRAAKLYRRIAGRLVHVYCIGTANDESAGTGGNDLISGVGSGVEPLRVPKRGRKLVTGDRKRGWDYCEIWLTARPVRRHGEPQRIGPAGLSRCP